MESAKDLRQCDSGGPSGVTSPTKRSETKSSHASSTKEKTFASDRSSTASQDKGRKGKRDGTPDKPNTPNNSVDADDDQLGAGRKHVIINEEILALQIKPENLEKLHEPRPPSDKRVTPVTTSVAVRRLKPASELDKPRTKTVTVAKLAHPDAPLKPFDLNSGAGPRFDQYGDIIPHSILGNVEDYQRMAVAKGDLPADVLTASSARDKMQQLTVKYEKKKEKTSKYPKFESTSESNALKNWERRMAERRRQQGYLSMVLDKPADHLVMNQADNYQQTQQTRYMIDRTMPLVEDGKGYRVGSEFWKQQERIGSELTGIHGKMDPEHCMTTTQTEKGYPVPIEDIGVPKTVLVEKGTNYDRPTTPFHKPWHRTPYLREKLDKLGPMMTELAPHRADLLNLELIGNAPGSSREQGSGGQIVFENGTQYDTLFGDQEPAQGSELYEDRTSLQGERMGEDGKPVDGDIACECKTECIGDQRDVASETGRSGVAEDQDKSSQENIDPLSDHPDVHPSPVLGPSLRFSDQAARWTGDSFTFLGQVGIEARVTFEVYANERTMSFLEVVNDGTTAIYFDWKSVPKSNPFEKIAAKVQRFYFNTNSGVLLPGQTSRIPFVFKSPQAGVYSEQWQLHTRPVLCGGASLIVTLRGVAIQRDKFKQQRTELERELGQRQVAEIVRTIVEELVEGVRTPPRPSSPIDSYLTESQIFSRLNTNLYYDHEQVSKVKEIHREIKEMEREKRRAEEQAERERLEAEREREREELERERAERGEVDDGEEAKEKEEEPQEEGEEPEGEEPEEELPEWDLSVDSLKQEIMNMDEDDDDEVRQQLLQRLNTAVISLSFPPYSPKQQLMYSTGYQLFSEGIDRMVGEATSLRAALGLPERDTEDVPEETILSRASSPATGSVMSHDSNGPSRKHSSVSRRSSFGKSQTSITSDHASAKSERGDKKGAKSKQDKKPKETKASKDGKSSSKEKLKDSGSKSSQKRPITREKEQSSLPTSGVNSPAPTTGDPLVEAKYKEKLYPLAHVILTGVVAQMESVFRDIEQNSGGPKSHALT